MADENAGAPTENVGAEAKGQKEQKKDKDDIEKLNAVDESAGLAQLKAEEMQTEMN